MKEYLKFVLIICITLSIMIVAVVYHDVNIAKQPDLYNLLLDEQTETQQCLVELKLIKQELVQLSRSIRALEEQTVRQLSYLNYEYEKALCIPLNIQGEK